MQADNWEGGHRVPFIISWPGKIQSGSVSDQLFGLNDLIATLAAVTGAPDREYEASFDFNKVWLGMSDAPVREDLIHHSIQGMFYIRKDRKSTRLNSSHSCASRLPSSACKQNTSN